MQSYDRFEGFLWLVNLHLLNLSHLRNKGLNKALLRETNAI